LYYCVNYVLDLAWLLTLMIIGHALVIGAWRLVTAAWRAQRSFRWPGKVHSFGSVNRSHRGCYSV